MLHAPPATDPLRAFLSGKRASPRLPIDATVVLRAHEFEIRARAVDASEGGVLLAIDEGAFDAASRGATGDAILHVHKRLEKGFDVDFVDCGMRRRAVPVRAATPSSDGARIFLGCRFAKPLTIRDQRTLGLLQADRVLSTPDWTEPVLLGSLSHVVRPRRMVSVLAFDERAAIAGPRFVGRLEGAGGSALSAIVAVPRQRGLFDLLGKEAIRCEVRVGAECIWTVMAKPAAVQLIHGDEVNVTIGLQSRATPPRRLRDLLTKRR